MLFAATLLIGCDEQVGGYIRASSIITDGFVSDRQTAANARSQEIKLWGFVDHGNLYGDSGAKQTLQEWWAGQGPDADTWRFNLKTEADDAVGHSFPVHVPNAAGRENLLRRFVADARSRKPTKVFVRGRLLTFEAPNQARVLTGLYLELESSRDIRYEPPEGE